MPLDFDDCLAAMAGQGLAPFEDSIKDQLGRPIHGNEKQWDQALAALPAIVAEGFTCDRGAIAIGPTDQSVNLSPR